MPYGNSIYHGWANQLTRRFSNGLQFIAAYTWSHNIDNSTADVFSTYTTPRRPQDFQNINGDRSDSALDHRQRFTWQVIYDVPFLKHDQNWFMRNILGSWEFAPVYQYQTGTWSTVQSGVDSNLNGDSAGDRTIVNPGGNPDGRQRHHRSDQQRRADRCLPGQQPERRLRGGAQGHASPTADAIPCG